MNTQDFSSYLISETTLRTWTHALQLRDPETYYHSLRVADTANDIALALGLNDSQRNSLRRGALLHDIGKISIPDTILHKPGHLDDDEWSTMRQHPLMGYQLLFTVTPLVMDLDAPLHHHERWDGAGYPHKIQGETIPLAARIVAVADAWDAMQFRKYSGSEMTTDAALMQIYRGAGTQFDPAIAGLFLEMQGALQYIPRTTTRMFF